MVSKQCLCVPTQLTSTVNLVALADGSVAIISLTRSLFQRVVDENRILFGCIARSAQGTDQVRARRNS